MKHLTLIRHAKSSWDNPSFTDFERPLNKRGIHDAPKVGAVLEEAGISFDRVLCSDARRARQTLSLLRQGVAIDDDLIEYRSDMYGASAHHLLSCLAEQQDINSDIALVGHNPGMEDLAHNLAEDAVGAMSTCNVVRLEFDCENWCDLSSASGKVVLTIRPRDL
ncbi:MAG: histidine phosphatase family protein [Gammaproteobacteria bacterium]|nr:histidine phosphatase family protein [Gammaproteobacteria bacterium]MDX2486661.1 histidine phosphatase family protein [Gammaproteobacteria bacterium]